MLGTFQLPFLIQTAHHSRLLCLMFGNEESLGDKCGEFGLWNEIMYMAFMSMSKDAWISWFVTCRPCIIISFIAATLVATTDMNVSSYYNWERCVHVGIRLHPQRPNEVDRCIVVSELEYYNRKESLPKNFHGKYLKYLILNYLQIKLVV